MAQHLGCGVPTERRELQAIPRLHAGKRCDGGGRRCSEPQRAPDGRSGCGGAVSDGVRAVGQEREEDVHVRLRLAETP